MHTDERSEPPSNARSITALRFAVKKNYTFPFAVLIDFISKTLIVEQDLFKLLKSSFDIVSVLYNISSHFPVSDGSAGIPV